MVSSVNVITNELSPVELIFAQKEDNNVIEQEGDGNDASQSEEDSQETDQNSQSIPIILSFLVNDFFGDFFMNSP
ncbi:hypothetical protein [Candidatus Nitrosocosmicus sp. R]